jgi:hypothetical protein
MHIRETRQVGDEEQVKEQLDIRRLFIMLKLRVIEEGCIVCFDLGIFIVFCTTLGLSTAAMNGCRLGTY